MQEIPLSEFIGRYEEFNVWEIVVVKDRIYGRSSLGTGGGPEVVWAAIP